MDLESIIAIVLIFGSVPFIVWMSLRHKLKVREKSAELIAAMIAKDKDITPEVVKAVGFAAKRAHGDLRSGLLSMAVGFAFVVLGQMIPDDEAGPAMAGIASFPLLVGLALIVFWYFVSRKEDG